MNRLIRATFAIAVLAVAAACGTATGVDPTAGDTPSVLGPPTPASTETAPPPGMPTLTIASASATPMSSTAFAHAMAAYCTTYYTEQRTANETYPGSDADSLVGFDRAAVALDRRTGQQLDRLTPPPDLAAPFAQFVDVTAQMAQARVSMLDAARSTGHDSDENDTFNQLLAERWPLAAQLHADRCDGELPPDQRAAVLAVAKEWATTLDPEVACTKLVTPWFQWSADGGPFDLQGMCAHVRENQNSGALRLPTDIAPLTLHGVNDLTASLTYAPVGGCGCSVSVYMRLFYLHGQWLVTTVEE